MNRVLLLLTAALSVVVGLLIVQNSQQRRAALAPETTASLDEVSNVETVAAVRPGAAPETALPTDAAATLDALSGAVGAALAPTPVQSDPAADMPVAVESPEEASDLMQVLTSSVLSDLGIQPVAPEPTPTPTPVSARKPDTNSAIREATALALVGLGEGGNIDPSAVSREELKIRVIQALRTGEGDAYVDMLLKEAVASGDIQVSAGLITSDGNLDTRAMLASLVSQSMKTDAAAAASADLVAAVADSTSNTKLALSNGKNGARYYVVEPGDSLAYISMMIYGDAVHYTKIFEANSDKLSAPNKIRVGQRLLIPNNV